VIQIEQIIKFILENENLNLDNDTPLIGVGGLLDSLTLVELCLKLEDLSNEFGFVFDWTSSTALSSNKSIFRNIGSLINEFERQKNLKL
jgi:acyl carrier protein